MFAFGIKLPFESRLSTVGIGPTIPTPELCLTGGRGAFQPLVCMPLVLPSALSSGLNRRNIMEDELKRVGVGIGTAEPRRLAAGKLTGQKQALKMKEAWSIRARLELEGDARNLALFNLALDRKLWRCDLVRLKVGDVAAGGHVKSRGVIIQKKTGRLV